MFKRYLFLVATFSLLTACGSKKKVAEVHLGTKKEIAYTSLGNDVAFISLQLFKNNTFQLKFKSISQPDSSNTPVNRSEIGTYTGEDNWKTLQFLNKDFDPSIVFDTKYNNPNEIKLLDKNTVQINTSQPRITIWGVLCEKK